MKPRRITFGEEIEIAGIKDEISEIIQKGNNYWSNIVTLKLRKIGKISEKNENSASEYFCHEENDSRKLCKGWQFSSDRECSHILAVKLLEGLIKV